MTVASNPPPDSVLSRAIAYLDAALCTLFIVGGAFLFWALTWGPAMWRSGPSLEFVAGLGLPWPAIGTLWLIYSLLLTNARTRVTGYLLGLILATYYTVSLFSAAVDDRLTSVLAVVLIVFATAGQGSGLIRSMVAAERKR